MYFIIILINLFFINVYFGFIQLQNIFVETTSSFCRVVGPEKLQPAAIRVTEGWSSIPVLKLLLLGSAAEV
jgi:hypothetical protein